MPNQLDNIIDFKQFLYKLYYNWYYILLSLVIALIIAFAYIRYTTEYFVSEASVIIEEQSNSNLKSSFLPQNVLPSSKNLENKKFLLTSFPLVSKTIKDLNFDIIYYIEGNIKVTESYLAPIKLQYLNDNKINGSKFKINILDDNKYSLLDVKTKKEYINKFGEEFLFKNTKLVIYKNSKYPKYNKKDPPTTIIEFKDVKSLTNVYKNKIEINQKDPNASILTLSIKTQDELKGVVFLNKLIDNFIEDEKNSKNLESVNTIKFINNQLEEMSDSLSLIEQKLEQYKNSNQIINLDDKSKTIFTNIVSLETEVAKFRTLNNYYDYLLDYFDDGANLENISISNSFGIEDENLNSLISKLAEIQINKNILIDGGQINNPAIKKYNIQIQQLVSNLQETIKTSKSANTILLKDYQSRIKKMEKTLSDIPQLEMDLLNIERLQSISENIYTFLLQKRAEANIDLSRNEADTKVFEPAVFFNKKPIDPNPKTVYLYALLVGLIIPILYFVIHEIFNDKILTKKDLQNLTSIPIIGFIGKNYSGNTLLSKHSPKSVTFEGFRALRSNLSSLLDHSSNKNFTFLVTSSVSGEGKTYLAENLSIVYAKSGMKTIVVGADLRKPKLYSDFGIVNNKGITNYVSSDIKLSEIIIKTEIENLDIIVSGPLPSDPSDILLSDNFQKMISDLKKQYDIIIIDTPPIGLVADSFTLMSYSDLNLFVLRQGYTKKGLISYIDDLNKNNRINNLQIVFNDVKEGSGAYGYSYGYGYGYGYGYSYDGYTER